jgi:ABC-type phosphate transport system substrate-binding protein
LIAAFNVPELTDLQLVLSFEVIAAIYENRLTMWNDQRIKDLNSANVSNALPDEPIVVVTTSAVSARTQLFTTALSRSVPEFTVFGPSAMQRNCASPSSPLFLVLRSRRVRLLRSQCRARQIGRL